MGFNLGFKGLKVSSNGNDFDLHVGGYRFEFQMGVRVNNLS